MPTRQLPCGLAAMDQGQGASCACTPLPQLTICTHSIRGRRTVWFPLSDTTQAGVSGVACRRATTASTPMRLACK